MALDQLKTRIELEKKKKKEEELELKKKESLSTKDRIIIEIRKIYDPEIPVNIYELGLIYDVKVKEDKAKIIMTLTTPNCPVAESLPQEVKDSAMQVEGIKEVDLDLVFEPPWEKSMMSEAAKLELNL